MTSNVISLGNALAWSCERGRPSDTHIGTTVRRSFAEHRSASRFCRILVILNDEGGGVTTGLAGPMSKWEFARIALLALGISTVLTGTLISIVMVASR